MSKLKHTPGPWKYQNEKWNTVKKPDDAEYCIGGELFNVCNILDTVDPEANARLIAAAPEMLEALIMIYKVWHEDSILISSVKAIIEKATGLTIEEVLNEN